MSEATDVFFFNDTATTEIYTLSHTTLFRSPIEEVIAALSLYYKVQTKSTFERIRALAELKVLSRSEEHTSELQSH